MNHKRYVLALDQGTISTRAILFDFGESAVVASHQLSHKQYFPQAGWVEHDPLEILRNARLCIAAVCHQAQKKGIDPTEVECLGLTNQRETAVAWDRTTGQPLHPAIVWQDTRTRDLCAALAEAPTTATATTDAKPRVTGSLEKSPQRKRQRLPNVVEESGVDRFRHLTGLPISTYFSGTKYKWLIENVPQVRKGIEDGTVLLGTIDSWLAFHLTEERVHITDVTNASRSLLMELQTQHWSSQLLDTFGVPKEALPVIRSSAERYGTLTGTECALDGRIPLAGILGDQHAAMLGQACLRADDLKCTYGTGCFLMLHTGEKRIHSRHGLLTVPAYQLGRDQPIRYALEGSVAIAGAGLEWLREQLGLIQDISEVEPLARSVPDTGDVYLVPAFNGLFAPRWRADARGVLVGMTQFTNRAHIARAMLEQVCFQTTEVIEAALADLGQGTDALQMLRVDGGMTANELLLQLQADLLGVPVVRPKIMEATALGAAAAASLATGALSRVDQVRSLWREDLVFTPSTSDQERKQRHRRWNEAVERSLGWVSADSAMPAKRKE
jgi:glycerol kinase